MPSTRTPRDTVSTPVCRVSVLYKGCYPFYFIGLFGFLLFFARYIVFFVRCGIDFILESVLRLVLLPFFSSSALSHPALRAIGSEKWYVRSSENFSRGAEMKKKRIAMREVPKKWAEHTAVAFIKDTYTFRHRASNIVKW